MVVLDSEDETVLGLKGRKAMERKSNGIAVTFLTHMNMI